MDYFYTISKVNEIETIIHFHMANLLQKILVNAVATVFPNGH